MIRVSVLGAGGRMGQHVCQAVIDDHELQLVAAVDPHHAGIDLDQVGIHGTGLQMAAGPQALGDADAEVAVDFTVLDAARENLEWCADHSVHAVVGTTGFRADELKALRKRFADAGANAVIAPNFAIGAVLMMRLAELAAPYFDTAEVIELHHDNKVDAPSGTAMMTVQRIADASSDWAADPTKSVVAEGARGGIGPGGIRVHSLRIRGLVGCGSTAARSRAERSSSTVSASTDSTLPRSFARPWPRSWRAGGSSPSSPWTRTCAPARTRGATAAALRAPTTRCSTCSRC